MKVAIYETVEVSDEQRVQIANLIDGNTKKRQATRDEMKEFIWESGADWAIELTDLWATRFDADGNDVLAEDEEIQRKADELAARVNSVDDEDEDDLGLESLI